MFIKTFTVQKTKSKRLESLNSLFQKFWAVITKDSQGIFTLNFPFDLFVKDAYPFAKIFHIYNGFFSIYITGCVEIKFH